MRRIFPLALTTIALAAASTATLANPALAQQKNCMACHAVATRVVGPSYKEIAARYATQDDALAQLSERVVTGSTGRWGFVPMPPNAQVSADEAKALTAWILQQK
ncbi:MAG: c-type cytochrome [Rubrivivax sp.]|nr:MAG: c-type cytochrome [Rubrivivax sp.]